MTGFAAGAANEKDRSCVRSVEILVCIFVEVRIWVVWRVCVVGVREGWRRGVMGVGVGVVEGVVVVVGGEGRGFFAGGGMRESCALGRLEEAGRAGMSGAVVDVVVEGAFMVGGCVEDCFVEGGLAAGRWAVCLP